MCVRFPYLCFFSAAAPVAVFIAFCCSPAKGCPGKPVWLFKVTRSAPQQAALGARRRRTSSLFFFFFPSRLLICCPRGVHSLYSVEFFRFEVPLPPFFFFYVVNLTGACLYFPDTFYVSKVLVDAVVLSRTQLLAERVSQSSSQKIGEEAAAELCVSFFFFFFGVRRCKAEKRLPNVWVCGQVQKISSSFLSLSDTASYVISPCICSFVAAFVLGVVYIVT